MTDKRTKELQELQAHGDSLLNEADLVFDNFRRKTATFKDVIIFYGKVARWATAIFFWYCWAKISLFKTR